MSLVTIAPMTTELSKVRRTTIPLNLILKLSNALRKTVLSKKFYEEVTEKVLSKPSTIDANLYFICYFTLMVSSVLNNKVQIKNFLSKQRLNLIRLIDRVYFQTFGKSFKESSSKPVARIFSEEERVYEEPKDGEPVSKLAVHLKAISTYLSDVRIFNRLFDSVKYIPWVIDEFNAFMNPTSGTALDRFSSLFQAVSCLLLEYLENIGWLVDPSHNWIGTNDNNWWCIESYIWCCRVWGAYLVADIFDHVRKTSPKGWDKNWRIALFTKAIQIPLVMHWASYNGCLSPFWVGVCGSGASWYNFKNMWMSLKLD